MPTKTQTAAPADVAKPIAVSKLRFDAENPRILELARELEGTPTQSEILKVLWREFAVDEIAYSIAANEYFQHEPLFAAREGGQLVVIEGNRRLAAVRLLTSAADRNAVGATDLPKITANAAARLSSLPVIETTRAAIWHYVGFKHVNGPQAWQSFAKAEYIAWVFNKLKIPLDQIAKNIGDQHSTVRRLYRAIMALEQAEAAGVFDRRDRLNRHFSFSHLYTGLDYLGIQKFTGISGDKSYQRKPIPPGRLSEFGEFCVWLYGSKSKNLPALVKSQNPDLRRLDEVLVSKNGVAALRRGLPLSVSLDISKGDAALFREALVDAKRALQDARGRLLTGFAGETDLMDSAEAILELAKSVHSEMRSFEGQRRAKRRAR